MPDYDQNAKADAGKLRLTLVPREIIRDIAAVREFAVNGKYKDLDNWKQVEACRYRDAAFRHFLAYLDDPESVDEESGLPHLAHLATNIAFLCELEKAGKKTKPDFWIYKREGEFPSFKCPACGYEINPKTFTFGAFEKCPQCGAKNKLVAPSYKGGWITVHDPNDVNRQ